MYIKNNLTNGFIKSFKYFTRAPIFFDKKLNKSLQLYINYQNFNDLIIKIHYSLFLVEELLDQLGWA